MLPFHLWSHLILIRKLLLAWNIFGNNNLIPINSYCMHCNISNVLLVEMDSMTAPVYQQWYIHRCKKTYNITYIVYYMINEVITQCRWTILLIFFSLLDDRKLFANLWYITHSTIHTIFFFVVLHICLLVGTWVCHRNWM